MKEPLVDIHDISKHFEGSPHLALKDINATIPRGEIVGLAGPDGAGKTTLIRLIAGLLKPTTGKITVDGLDTIQDASAIRHIIGYMPQKFGLYEDLTVQQNLQLYADLRGVTGDQRQEIFANLLSFTALKPFVDRLAKALSGGMKQKLGLACALIRKPTLLLLDEPSVGVDPVSRRELWKMVNNLLDDGISVVWSTAYLDEAEKCNTVLLLNEGQLVFYGKPDKLAQRVDGRVFRLSPVTTNAREVLMHALQQPDVIDGVIQGDDVRIVTKDKDAKIDVAALQGGPDARLIPTSPRFEDAFIDILGGAPKGPSPLAEKTPEVKTTRTVMIEAQALTKRFGTFTAASHINLSVRTGEIFGLLGPNGAGKTTTFKMMCGLLKPTEGKSSVNGIDLQDAPGKARAQIGYMAQKFSLYGDLSVRENLEFFSGVYGLWGNKQLDAIQEMVETFHLKDYLKEPADRLPLGYKQRLALSCALMHNPLVLFLDEPTSGVDPITRREFWSHINSLVQKNVTVIVTTHFMDEAEYCDRIALVYRSKLIRMGTPEDLKETAKTEQNPCPTLEDAFIRAIEVYDMENGKDDKR
ncbi:MAG: ATP-binding cassette domain-containing protein [Chlamydiales bacterium]|nr:ATP-binding cassette domain-containing protein [Chlamydiales bacterium]